MALVVKNPPANAGDVRDMGSIPGLERSLGGGHDNPLQYSCLENPSGQRSLEGYSPWGHAESDLTCPRVLLNQAWVLSPACSKVNLLTPGCGEAQYLPQSAKQEVQATRAPKIPTPR